MPCSTIPSEDVALGPVIVDQTWCGVWGRIARFGIAWAVVTLFVTWLAVAPRVASTASSCSRAALASLTTCRPRPSLNQNLANLLIHVLASHIWLGEPEIRILHATDLAASSMSIARP